jgi:hypothetical protein
MADAGTINRDEGLCAGEGPQSALEKKFVEEYLAEKGYSLEEVKRLPEEEAKRLMREACQHAALKLAEVESKVRFRKKIHFPSG